MARSRVLASLGLTAVLALAASPSRAADYPCGREFRPLAAPEGRAVDVFDLLFPPKYLLEGLMRDRVSTMARREIRFGALDEAGKPAAGARIAVVYEGVRHLADVAAEGAAELPAGDYVLVAARSTPDGSVRWGSRAVAIGEKGEARFDIRLDQKLDPIAPGPLSGPAAAGRLPAGAVVNASWYGPHQATGRLVFTRRGDQGREAVADVPVGSEAPARLEAPIEPGSYDLHLLLCAPRLSLATWPIEVAPADLRLVAPAAVDAGSKIPIRVEGHTGLDFAIALVGPGGDLAKADANEETPKATLTAPLRPGRFELVYRTSGKGDGAATVLARRSLEIRPVALEIRAPARAKVGEPIDLGWTGSSGPGRLELWTVAADGQAATRLRPNLEPGRHLLPAGAGPHEVRLVDATDEKRVLARRPITVTGAMFSKVPEKMKPGERFAVGLARAPGSLDMVAFVARGGGVDGVRNDERFDPDGKRTVEIVAPKTPGAWDLLYLAGTAGEDDVVIDRRPFVVE